jgi:hypothetical protein
LFGNENRSAVGLPTAATTAVAVTASADPQRIVASLAKDGTLSLRVADQPAATAKGPGLLSRQPAEDFCVGHDNRKPVTAYTAKAAFQGRIMDLRVTIP